MGGPQGGVPGGPKKGGKKKCPKTVPTGRIIKYPKKCALFGPPGGPPGPPQGGPKGHPFPWELFYPFSIKLFLYCPRIGPFWPILGPPFWAPFWGPPEGGPGGARGGPGGPPGNFRKFSPGPGAPPGGSRRGVPEGGLSGVPANDATNGLGRVPIRSQSLDGPSSGPNVKTANAKVPMNGETHEPFATGGRGAGAAKIWHRMCPNFVGPPPPPWAATARDFDTLAQLEIPRITLSMVDKR